MIINILIINTAVAASAIAAAAATAAAAAAAAANVNISIGMSQRKIARNGFYRFGYLAMNDITKVTHNDLVLLVQGQNLTL